MIETDLLELVSDELEQFYADAERDRSRFKLILSFSPDELDLSIGLEQFTLSEPKKKFKPKVNRTKSRKSNNPNMF